jgi:hypothetical protein
MDQAITIGDVLLFVLLAGGGIAGFSIILWVLTAFARGMSK